MNLVSKLGSWLGARGSHAEPPAWNCCGKPQQVGESRDMGHANSFELDMTSCGTCGAHWASLFCVANGKTGWERVTDAEAKALLDAPIGPQQQAVLRAWIDSHT